MKRVGILCVSLGLALLPTAAAARTLHWSELAVTARLDADGRLRVEERQAMVFDGAWNGGERRFWLRGEQKIELHGITRIDPETGTATELSAGDLGRVDAYSWVDRETLRWRARLPSDPEFENETIVYVLDYTLSGVVERTWGAYVLDHDFAFADRVGPIERFTLDLELDPVWRPRRELLRRVEYGPMPPGESYVVTAKLDHTGGGRPVGVHFPPPLGLRLALVAAALAVIVVLFLRFQRVERLQGRFDPPDVPAGPSRAWLEEHLLRLRPEEVGALWDRTIGPPEVSAVLARLVAEGKLASRVEKAGGRWKKDVLHLELLVGRDSFEGYERKLVDKLFFNSRTRTSTEAVREHYKSKGFSPATMVREKLQKRLDRLPGIGEKEPAPSKGPTAALVAVVLALLVVEGLTRGELVLRLLGKLAASGIVPVIAGFIGAHWRQRKADELLTPTLLFMVPLGLMLGGLWSPVVIGRLAFPAAVTLSWVGMATLLVFGVTIANSFLNTARTRDTKEAIRLRKRMAAVRRHFKSELAKANPDLEDEWFPYLLAFGLARDVDKWSVAHGSGATGFSPAQSGSFSGGTVGGWTGGGGSFGGAGATAGWAAAATGLAAGVAAPSSSGGGGGGGGGGSSGGGGGGGW